MGFAKRMASFSVGGADAPPVENNCGAGGMAREAACKFVGGFHRSNKELVLLLGYGRTTPSMARQCLLNWHQKYLANPSMVFAGRPEDRFPAEVVRAYPARSKKLRPHTHASRRNGPVKKIKADDFLQSYEWRELRMKALIRDGRKCACCGATPETGAVMNVDHIKPRRLHPELALCLENLQVLCAECNHGKGNWDQTDWRLK